MCVPRGVRKVEVLRRQKIGLMQQLFAVVEGG